MGQNEQRSHGAGGRKQHPPFSSVLRRYVSGCEAGYTSTGIIHFFCVCVYIFGPPSNLVLVAETFAFLPDA